MRVLQIGLSKNPGGIETLIMTYFRQLVHKDIVFDFIDIYGDGLAFDNEIQSLGGKIYHTPNYKKHPIKARRAISKIINDNEYKVIHVNMLSAANLLPLIVAKRAGCIVFAHSHNSSVEGFLRAFLHNRNLHKLRRMNVVRLACGKAAGEWMWGDLEYEIIPNAIIADKFSFSASNRQQIRNMLDIAKNDFVIGFVGRLAAQKNPFYLVDIICAVKQRAKRNIKLLIVGDGVLRNDVLLYATERSVIKDIVFVGSQNDTSVYYSAMDCFVLPSLYEGFPIVGVEAQANGLPCFVSEYVTHDIKIADSLRFLSLDNGANNWANAIVSVVDKYDVFERINNIKGTQYDSDVSATKLSDVYWLAEKI